MSHGEAVGVILKEVFKNENLFRSPFRT